MTEKQLKKLGFEKQKYNNKVIKEKFYYYTLDIGSFELITLNCNDEINNKHDWSVGIFNSIDIQINDYKTLKNLIKIIKKCLV